MAPLGCLSLSVTQCVHPPARHRLIRAQRGNPRAPAWQRLSGFSRQLCWQRSRSAGILQAQKRAAMRPAALCKQDLQLMDSDVPGILIVDDNDDNRYTLQLLLEADGHTRLATAAGGQEALDLLAREKFSLVLLDMMMPDLNGDEVLRIIKSNPDTRDVSVVVLSADTDTERVAKCIEIGADDYLPKPFNPTILRARISSELRKRSLRSLESEYLERIEQEKKHSEALLRNILPPEIATRLRAGETNISDHVDDATILFADVVGFGKITARMRAFEVVACLNRLFSEFDRLADDVGCEKIKTIGDSYMAAVGLPAPRANHARIAAKLALDLVTAAQRLQSSLPAPFPIRVGVHSGPIMAGVIGTRKFAYDVWGDTVNIASRIEAAGQPNRVLVSATTAKHLDRGFKLDGPHTIETKEHRIVETFFISRGD
jgi:adenylate cyclase